MKTVAIYKKTQDGMLRLGTFTPREFYSIRSVSEQFMAKHPDADPATLYIARRNRIMGRIVDGEIIPFDVALDDKVPA